MKINKKKVVATILILVLLIVGILLIVLNQKEDFKNEFQPFQNLAINEIKIQENNLTEEQKEELENTITGQGITGDSDLYEVQTGYNEISVAVIKPSIKYKVAFAGMIKASKPQMNELDSIIENNHPKYAGIWVEKNSREKFLTIVKKYARSNYIVDETGYLRVESSSNPNDYDKKLEKAISGNQLYIICLSSIYYTVDDITGEILDYNFEQVMRGQTYEYFNDNDRYLIFITENKKNTLSEKEIFESLIDLI